MNPAIVDLVTQCFYLIMMLSLPPIMVASVVAVSLALFQAITQLQEQTLTFVPKVLAIFSGMMLLGHWMLNNMVDFMTRLWSDFSLYIK